MALSHNALVGRARCLSMSGSKEFGINAWVTKDARLESVTDVFVGWRASEHECYGLLFPTSTEASQFSQAWKLASALAARGAVASSSSAASVGLADRPAGSTDEFDQPVAPISFGKAITMSEDSIRALLTSAQNAVANPSLNYDQMVSTAIAQMHTVLKLLLRLFVSKIRERRAASGVSASEQKTPVIEKLMRSTFKLITKTGSDGLANEYTLRAAVGQRRVTVLRMLVDKIYEAFTGSLALAQQLLAGLNAIKLIDNRSTSVGRQEGACMTNFCAISQRIVSVMRQLADTVATFGQIARSDVLIAPDAVDSDGDAEAAGRPYYEELGDVEPASFAADVKGYTLNQLVQRLTSTKQMDMRFQSCFFTTYQSFASARVLFEKLKERYEGTKEKDVQVRVAIILKHWLEHSFGDFDSDILDHVKAFLEARLIKDHAGIGQKLLKYVTEHEQERARDVDFKFTVPSVIFEQAHKEKPTSTHNALALFYDMDVNTMAEQLTIRDAELFSRVQPAELLQQSWNNKRRKWRAPYLIALAARSTTVSFWVASLILSQTQSSQRVHMMSKMVDLAAALRALNNFHTLMAVISGLNTSPIHRMKAHWLKIGKKKLQLLESLNEQMVPDNSFKSYRAALEASKPPALPFVVS